MAFPLVVASFLGMVVVEVCRPSYEMAAAGEGVSYDLDLEILGASMSLRKTHGEYNTTFEQVNEIVTINWNSFHSINFIFD